MEIKLTIYTLQISDKITYSLVPRTHTFFIKTIL